MKLIKAVQYFSDEYIESIKGATPEQILQFVENYRQLQIEVAKKRYDKYVEEMLAKGETPEIPRWTYEEG